VGCVLAGLAYVVTVAGLMSFFTDSPVLIVASVVTPVIGVAATAFVGDLLERMGIY
jgi:hypothetical protein